MANKKEKKTKTIETEDELAFRRLAEELGQIDSDKVEFFLACKKYKTEIDLRIEAFYNQYQLSPGRFQILLILRCAEGYALLPSELAKKTGVSRASMTQFLDSLEKAGYVERKAFPGDRRAILIQISVNGLKTLNKKILPLYFMRSAKFSNRCTKTEMKQFTAMYEKISKNLAEFDQD